MSVRFWDEERAFHTKEEALEFGGLADGSVLRVGLRFRAETGGEPGEDADEES